MEKINKNGEILINVAGKAYRDVIMGIEEEIEMCEFQLTQSKKLISHHFVKTRLRD